MIIYDYKIKQKEKYNEKIDYIFSNTIDNKHTCINGSCIVGLVSDREGKGKRF